MIFAEETDDFFFNAFRNIGLTLLIFILALTASLVMFVLIMRLLRKRYIKKDPPDGPIILS